MDTTFAEGVVATGTSILSSFFDGGMSYLILVLPVLLGLIAIAWFFGALRWLVKKVRGVGRS